MASGAVVPSIQFQFDYEKTKGALLYLAARVPEFDRNKACKLLFLADREHLIRLARPITGDRYEAFPTGPVPSKTKELLVGMEFVLKGQTADTDPEAKNLASAFSLESGTYYKGLQDPDPDALSESDLTVLEEVANEHGDKFSGPEADLTTKIAAYRIAWHEESGKNSFPMAFEDFFADAPNGDVVLREVLRRERLRRAFPDPACD